MPVTRHRLSVTKLYIYRTPGKVLLGHLWRLGGQIGPQCGGKDWICNMRIGFFFSASFQHAPPSEFCGSMQRPRLQVLTSRRRLCTEVPCWFHVPQTHMGASKYNSE